MNCTRTSGRRSTWDRTRWSTSRCGWTTLLEAGTNGGPVRVFVAVPGGQPGPGAGGSGGRAGGEGTGSHRKGAAGGTGGAVLTCTPGESLPEGTRSLAFRIRFRAADQDPDRRGHEPGGERTDAGAGTGSRGDRSRLTTLNRSHLREKCHLPVIPAKAGIQQRLATSDVATFIKLWIPDLIRNDGNNRKASGPHAAGSGAVGSVVRLFVAFRLSRLPRTRLP